MTDISPILSQNVALGLIPKHINNITISLVGLTMAISSCINSDDAKNMIEIKYLTGSIVKDFNVYFKTVAQITKRIFTSIHITFNMMGFLQEQLPFKKYLLFLLDATENLLSYLALCENLH